MEVVGSEGAPRDGVLLAWGAAALRDGDTLVNPMTGARTDFSTFAELERSGHITRVPEPLPISDSDAGLPLVVLDIHHASRLQDLLIPLRGDLSRIVAECRLSHRSLFVVPGVDALAGYREHMPAALRALVAYASIPEEEGLAVVNAALVLDPGVPTYHALRAALSRSPAKALLMARALLRDGSLVHQLYTEFTEFSRLRGTKDCLSPTAALPSSVVEALSQLPVRMDALQTDLVARLDAADGKVDNLAVSVATLRQTQRPPDLSLKRAAAPEDGMKRLAAKGIDESPPGTSVRRVITIPGFRGDSNWQ